MEAEGHDIIRFSIQIERAAKKEIDKFPAHIRAQVALKISALATEPRPSGCVKLTNRDAYRIRAGDYRIIYEIYEKQLVVLVIDAGNRREVYKKR